MEKLIQTEYPLEDSEKIAMAGPGEANFIKIEKEFGVNVLTRKPGIILRSRHKQKIIKAKKALDGLRDIYSNGHKVENWQIDRLIKVSSDNKSKNITAVKQSPFKKPLVIDKYGKPVFSRTPGQESILEALIKHDILLISGPAGTGKTFLAVALAVHYLQEHLVEKIVLVRPAVESGENLGYLPGDLKEKIGPYMTPLFDALNILIPYDQLNAYKQDLTVEIAPLAYMRGRTLNNAFMILDEAQNTTIAQMKMFLTRTGVGSKVIVTGDETQIDLPKNVKSGLTHSQKLLKHIKGIAIKRLTVKDVVRHPLVRDIINAFEASPSRAQCPMNIFTNVKADERIQR